MIFVGRAAELRSLQAELAAVDRRRSRLVVVRGEAGVGKTWLIDRARDATHRDTLWLQGRGSRLRATSAFALAAEAIESYLRRQPPTAVAAACPDRLADLAAILPSVAVAMPSPSGPPSRGRVFEALLCLLGGLARDHAVVLVLDDLHDGDPSTWELVDYLARNPIEARLLVVVAVRSDALSVPAELATTLAALLQDDLATELRVGALDRPAIAELAIGALGPVGATAEIIDSLVDRTRGNALFVAALLEDLTTDPARRTLPGSIAERVHAMTERLEPRARDVLDLAAVLGMTFSLRSISSMLPAGEDEVVDRLAAAGLLKVATTGSGAGYEFTHPLVQEAVYGAIGLARRRELHLRVARTLPPRPASAVAYHAALGALPGDAWAIDVIRSAAIEAERTQSHREAMTWFREALDLVPPDQRRLRRETLDSIAAHAAAAGDHRTGIAAVGALLDDAWIGDREAGVLRTRLASFLATGAGDLPGAEREARTAIALLTADPDGGASRDSLDRQRADDPARGGPASPVANALNELGWIRGENGDVAGQVQEARRALALAEADGDRATTIHALGSLGHALGLLGETRDALSIIDRSITLALADGDRAQADWHAGTKAEILTEAGRFLDAAEVVGRILDGTESDIAYAFRARAAWFLGRWDVARADCRMVQVLHPDGTSMHTAWALSFGGLLASVTGDASSSGPLLAQAERAYGGRPFYWFSAWHDWAMGIMALRAGDAEAACGRLARAADRTEAMEARSIAVQVLPDLVDALATLGLVREASAATARLDALAERLGFPYLRAFSGLAHGITAGASRREAAARSSLMTAADAARDASMPFVRARALERLADASAGSERIGALAEAGRLYAALPAPGDTRRVAASLRGTGRSGARAAQAVGDLTPREREIAVLAADRWTTREIAERLGVGDRTVETHLAHVYGKLGISGRAELRGQRDRLRA